MQTDCQSAGRSGFFSNAAGKSLESEHFQPSPGVERIPDASGPLKGLPPDLQELHGPERSGPRVSALSNRPRRRERGRGRRGG